MKLPLFVLAGAVLGASALSAGPAAKAAPGVTVEFVHPERYTDVQLSGSSREESCDVLLPELRKFLQEQGANFVPAGASLSIRIVDIDDAGRINRGARRDLRVVSQGFPARIDFSWELRDARGAVLKRGNERLLQRAGESGEHPEVLGSMPTVKFAFQRWMRGTL